MSLLGFSSAIDTGDGSADLDGGGPGTDAAADLPTDPSGKARVVDGDLDSVVRESDLAAE